MFSPLILAHRGNLQGPDRRTENTVGAYCEALHSGFGLEIDVRRNSDGDYYIAHDAVTDRPDLLLREFESHFRACRDALVAVNVKELGYEIELAKMVSEGVFGDQAFLFDLELLEPAAAGRAQRLIDSAGLGSKVRMASRLSDRSEPLQQALSIPGEIVWADEFDSFWLTKEYVEAVHDAGRRFYMVSPDLHGFPREARLRRWAELSAWGIDALCTDFAFEARAFF